MVYDTMRHRMDAIEAGTVNLNLCSFSRSSRFPPTEWHAIVAANWRIAMPGASPLAFFDGAFGTAPAEETISCQFRM